MGIEMILRCGYFLMTATIILMILGSLNRTATVRARESDSLKYPPCTFNPLCTCSKTAPDFGIVQCRHVPFLAIPKTINNSKVFMLYMENTGLRSLEPYFLQVTGLYRLEISHNQITEIPDDSFFGLEKSLWYLMLQHNELIEIPSRAIRHLQKLTHLDLSGNQISCIELDSFRGLENSLHTLILSKNSINNLPADSFSTLPQLDTIDLSGNNLEWIDANIFRDSMPRLSKLLLSDNILRAIPYIATASLKQLRTHDLSHNLIREILPEEAPEPRAVVKLTLDSLHLEYNLIEAIYAGSFQRFDTINQTFLDGNPIMQLDEEAFRPTKIKELYIRHCSLQYISPIAFEGLGSSLQILDLSANNLTSLPDNLFDKFDVFRFLNLKDNRIKSLNPADVFNGFQYTLLKLDLSGEMNPVTSLQELRRMRNLRSLSLTKLSTKNLSPDDFLEFGLELEDLKITRGPLQTIKSHAFMHVRGVKHLDLSENKLNQIEPDAFTEIGHSLISLKITHGLTGTALPADAMRHLTSLQQLDLSKNEIKTMSDTSFHFLKNLQHLELQDNRIEQVLKGTFQGDLHANLESISMSFNHLRHISQHTLVDLEALLHLKLDDNRIEHLERRAFMNLDQLRHLTLRGNKLNTIADEAFQNFPELEMLDLAYNKLKSFEFDYFDQVGTLSALRVNVSHNNIIELVDNNTGYGLGRGEHGSIYHSNVKVLDLSHNNISKIYTGFFRPAEISLTHLYLGHNSIDNASRAVFGNMPHLQLLDLSHNIIDEIDYYIFKSTKSLQIVHQVQHEVSFDAIANIGRTEPKTPASTDLVKEFRSVTISGKSFNNIADTIFKGVQSIALHVTIRNSSLTAIPNFFRKLGRAENVSFDVHESNDKLGKIPNPNTGNIPNLPNAVFLTDLEVSSTTLSCDCGVGWIEYWQRKKRQYLVLGPSQRSSWAKKEDCNAINDDLHEANCANKNNQQLLEVLKSEIECGWNGASKNVKIIVSTLIISVVLALYF